ncbi:hypothetical protein [Caldalkalibacillus mannanilyticus]|uniref:hypothetical protein n=1 Tax=Caldalkalibacillus mannanilyticus TaxID=1418 RepID=UPI00046A5BEA|nr:hypothetical protein [Caldalkalibacillus mannanilyticus]
MFSFLKKTKLVKDPLKGIAKLMYDDVSDDAWDQENLTKRNLDFTIESIRYIDLYVNRLLTTEQGQALLNEHFDHLVSRIGAYIGEVIKSKIQEDFCWYEFHSVYQHSSNLAEEYRHTSPYTLLYSKKRDVVLSPLSEVAQFLQGKSDYPDFLAFVEHMVKQHS